MSTSAFLAVLWTTVLLIGGVLLLRIMRGGECREGYDLESTIGSERGGPKPEDQSLDERA